MFQHILVPLDGSSRAEQALPVAARLARASRGTLVLLQVVNPLTEFVLYTGADPLMFQPILDANLEGAWRYLESITRVSNLVDIHIETEVLVGQPAATILSAVETRPIDLIVLCSHGYTGMKRWALGSVAEKVARHAPVPLFLLHEGRSALIGAPPRVEGPLRALISLDGSTHANAAIVPAAQLIAALAAPRPAALHFTRVVVLPDAEYISQHERNAVIDRAKQYLSSTVEQIRTDLVTNLPSDLKLDLTWSVTIDDDIAAGIIRVAEQGENVEGTGVFGPSDLIALASYGQGGLQRWAMGSITERVLQATRLPLLIMRPTAIEEQGKDKTTSTSKQE